MTHANCFGLFNVVQVISVSLIPRDYLAGPSIALLQGITANLNGKESRRQLHPPRRISISLRNPVCATRLQDERCLKLQRHNGEVKIRLTLNI